MTIKKVHNIIIFEQFVNGKNDFLWRCALSLFLSAVARCTVDVYVRRNGARSIIYCMVVSTTTESIFLQRIYKAINFHLILVYA